jgi:hypothetical protein
MTILRNRASISHALETEDNRGPRLHVSAAIVKEILNARQRGWNDARISAEYQVDPSVVEKVNHIAVPVDNDDGIVYPCSQ